MKKIVLATAAFLFASGMAFAGSDNYGSDYVPASAGFPNAGQHSMVDMSNTASIGTADSAAGGNSNADIPAPGQGNWGH